jgi:hypothetical protein
MKLQEIKEIAKKNSIKAGRMSKVELIKAFQRAEGNNDCFGASYYECNQINCLWREDCMKTV